MPNARGTKSRGAKKPAAKPRGAKAQEALVRTYAAPPRGFDVHKASERTRLRYGIPPRPREAPLQQYFDRVLSAPLNVVVPKFRRQPGVAGPLDLPLAPALPPQRHNHMGGATVTAPAAQGTMRWIQGTWTLPHIYRAPVDANGQGVSTWMGLFGESSTSNLFAGWDIRVSRSGAQQQYSYGVWWQWSPGSRHAVTNLPAEPGDVLSCVICLDLGSHVRARLYFHNLTSRTVSTFFVTAPSGTELTADTAGWAVGNMIIDFKGPFVARFGAYFFDECNAGTTDSPTILHPTQPVFLTNLDGTQDQAIPSILSDTMVRIAYAGP